MVWPLRRGASGSARSLPKIPLNDITGYFPASGKNTQETSREFLFSGRGFRVC